MIVIPYVYAFVYILDQIPVTTTFLVFLLVLAGFFFLYKLNIHGPLRKVVDNLWFKFALSRPPSFADFIDKSNKTEKLFDMFKRVEPSKYRISQLDNIKYFHLEADYVKLELISGDIITLGETYFPSQSEQERIFAILRQTQFGGGNTSKSIDGNFDLQDLISKLEVFSFDHYFMELFRKSVIIPLLVYAFFLVFFPMGILFIIENVLDIIALDTWMLTIIHMIRGMVLLYIAGWAAILWKFILEAA